MRYLERQLISKVMCWVYKIIMYCLLWMWGQMVLFLYLQKIYTESAEVKLPAVEDYLSTIIEVHNVLQFSEISILASSFAVNRSYASFFCLIQADCKFLIFAHHKILLDGIEKFLAVSLCYDIFVNSSKSFLCCFSWCNVSEKYAEEKAAVYKNWWRNRSFDTSKISEHLSGDG